MLSGMARRGGGLFLLLLFTSLFVSACNHLPVWQNEPLPSLEATAFVPTEMPPPSVAPTQRVEMPASPITQPQPSTTVTFAPTSLPDTAPVSTSTPEMFAYTVLPGESPSSIAYKFGITVQELLAANNLGEDALIYPDDRLLIPSPSQPVGPQPMPTYKVRPGDTLSSIAAQYDITVPLLQHVNGLEPDDIIVVGQELKMPFGAYEVQPGDRLLDIVAWYDNRISLEELARTNATQIDLENLDLVQAGIILEIPSPTGVVPDCRPTAERTGVITYTVQSGEGLACLALKFELQMSTIRHANRQLTLEDDIVAGAQLRILPADGVVYSVTEEDLAYSSLLSDIAGWYYVSPENVLNWQGEQVINITTPGTDLYIRGADPQAGDFDAAAWASYIAANPTPVSDASTVLELPQPPSPTTPSPVGGSSYTPPAGAPPPGAVRPSNYLWVGQRSVFDTGYCDLVDGYGWSGSLVWPIDSRAIREDRGFRPGHAAIDLDAPTGTPVFAAETGVVVWAGFNARGGGNIIVLAHGNTWQTYYVHLSEVFVSCGQAVAKGSTIGLSGQTGGVSWPHLHFEVQLGGFNYDPLAWLPGS